MSRGGPGIQWDEKDVARLRKMMAEGKSGRAICAAFPERSVNSVWGKIGQCRAAIIAPPRPRQQKGRPAPPPPYQAPAYRPNDDAKHLGLIFATGHRFGRSILEIDR